MIPPTIYAQKRRGEVGHAQLQVHCRYLKPPTGIDSGQKNIIVSTSSHFRCFQPIQSQLWWLNPHEVLFGDESKPIIKLLPYLTEQTSMNIHSPAILGYLFWLLASSQRLGRNPACIDCSVPGHNLNTSVARENMEMSQKLTFC